MSKSLIDDPQALFLGQAVINDPQALSLGQAVIDDPQAPSLGLDLTQALYLAQVVMIDFLQTLFLTLDLRLVPQLFLSPLTVVMNQN